MVRRVSEAYVGATKLFVWTSMDRTLHCYCCYVWNSTLQGNQRGVANSGIDPFRDQSFFQSRILTYSVWTAE